VRVDWRGLPLSKRLKTAGSSHKARWGARRSPQDLPQQRPRHPRRSGVGGRPMNRSLPVRRRAVANPPSAGPGLNSLERL